MIGWFKNLTDSSNLEIIALYLLVIIGAIAWARFIAKKHDAKWSSTVAPSFDNQGIKNHKKDNNGTKERDNQHKLEKGYIVWSYLLSKFRYKVRTNLPYYQTDNERDKQKQPPYRGQAKNFGHIRVILPFPISHIGNIVARLMAKCQPKWKRTGRLRYLMPHAS